MHPALAVAAALGPLLFGVAALVAPLLRPGDGIVEESISSFAVGSYGWLLRSTFFLLGAGSLALAWGLQSTMSPTGEARAGQVLLAVWGVGAILGGVYPADEANRDVHGVVVTVGFVAIVAGILALARAFGGDEWWRPRARSSAALGAAAAVTCLLTALTRTSWFGVSERLFIATVLCWLVLAARHLHRLATAPVRTGGPGRTRP